MELPIQGDLIFDVGMHLGEDTEFYLKKGFRVVAIEADPLHCSRVAERFAREVAKRQLVILNVAITKLEADPFLSESRHVHMGNGSRRLGGAESRHTQRDWQALNTI
jgi:16S rRNA A1518/A1519 N6-dimethyltransferase RsmA/KsgA/DIM1 with predicted DNA glycosylase/AP lyase activity